MKIIGIDNGVSGSITIIDTKFNSVAYHPTPTFKDLSYTKKAQWSRRIDTVKLNDILHGVDIDENPASEKLTVHDTHVYLERPMVNPTRFTATASALRAFEATLIVLERNEIPYEIVDSKAWQKMLLPKGIKGSANLKNASKNVVKKLFPRLDIGNKDADSVCIAEYGRRTYLKGGKE